MDLGDPQIGLGRCVGAAGMPQPVQNPQRTFAWARGVQIGTRPFVQVYAGDVDGVAPDDIVAVYEDGSVEIFLTIFNPMQPFLVNSGGVGWHSVGVVIPVGVAQVTTINFVGTLEGYGSRCRGVDFGCTTEKRAVFVGTANTDDYIFVSPDMPEDSCEASSEDCGRARAGRRWAPRAVSIDQPSDMDAAGPHQRRCTEKQRGVRGAP